MKLIIDISEEIYKYVDTIQNGSIGAKQIINSVKNGIPAYKAIPSAEPYKGMTNGEVLEAVFPNIDFCRNEFDGSMWVDMEDIAAFELDWWNSPYDPQESEDKE